ncbi:MAG: hypothetical protein PHE78_04835 [Candidatus Gastranaerophilales bacterium]|nr:hypothetical protein [Candidatus Gastranaerophilales bacterium]
MLDIKEEIQVLLLRTGLSMRKMIEKMNGVGLTKIQTSSLSRMLKEKTIKFELIQQILDFLGYELIIKKKQ